MPNWSRDPAGLAGKSESTINTTPMKTIRFTSAALLSACALAFATVALYAAPKETPEPSPKKDAAALRMPGKPKVIVKKVPAGKTALKLAPGYRFVRTSPNTAVVHRDNTATGIEVQCMCDGKGSCAMTTETPSTVSCKPTADGCPSCWMKTTVPTNMSAVLRHEAISVRE